MKKFQFLFLLTTALLLTAACDYYDYAGMNYLPPTYIVTPAHESTIPIDVAADFFSQMDAIWDEDDGDLWGFHLGVPFMFADPISRHVVANTPDLYGYFWRYDDVYVGILPDRVFVSHTVVDFNGLTWGMAAWGPEIDQGVVQGIEMNLLQLMIHEAFHAVQFQRIVTCEPVSNINPEHDGEMNASSEARTTLLLELNALKAALRADGDERLDAVRDALAIRAHRRYMHPIAERYENMQEIIEGLATFTEILVFGEVEALLEFYEGLMDMMNISESTGLVGFFPYVSGGMYALLLRDTDADWRHDITKQTDLAALLKEAMGIDDLPPFDQLDLDRYGFAETAPRQEAWVSRFQELRQGAFDFVAGPAIKLPGINHIEAGINVEVFWVPSEVDAWRDYLVFFGELVYVSAGWRLEVIGGYVRPEWYPNPGVLVAMYEEIEVSEDRMRAMAPTWILEIIDDAYMIEALENGGIEIARR